MKLTERVLEKLAEMVVGDHADFPYRSSQYITRFFRRCGLPFVHDGSTRRIWAQERLAELNLGTPQSPDLPSEDLVRVIAELFDSDDFDSHNERVSRPDVRDARILKVETALESFNKIVAKVGLVAYLDPSGRCHLRNTGTGVNSASSPQQSVWSDRRRCADRGLGCERPYGRTVQSHKRKGAGHEGEGTISRFGCPC